MNQLSRTLLGLLLCLTTAITQAQTVENKQPYLFAKIPAEFFIQTNTLASAFDYKVGEKATIQFSEQFNFEGVVLNNEVKYGNLQSIIIRSEANVLLSISKQFQKGLPVTYTGRIISKDAADGFFIQHTENRYALKKFSKENILQDCNF